MIDSRLRHVSNEGWIGLVGRIAAALDEIGVLIECGVKVDSLHDYGVKLGDGKKVEADVVILACGLKTATRLLKNLDEKRTKVKYSYKFTSQQFISGKGLENLYKIKKNSKCWEIYN